VKPLDQDYFFMAQAIAIAKKGQGKTHPNPCVGALVVHNGMIVGEGFHEKSGSAHAEVFALNNAGNKTQSSTLFVTLEPCSHYGKTPPCTKAIIDAGVSRVVIGMRDPNPLVNGQGLKALKDAGIETYVGLLEDECIKINEGFFYRFNKGRPFIRSKIASSLDGHTALESGESKWITSDASRQDVQFWRAKSSAILTGVGTVNTDNPNLDVIDSGIDDQPKRIILDTQLRIHPESHLLKKKNTYVCYCDDPNSKLNLLKKSNAQFVKLDKNNQQISFDSLVEFMMTLELNDILVEAGPTLNGSLLQAELIDEFVFYVSPTLLGGNAMNIFNLPILKKMDEKIKLRFNDIRQFDQDIRIISRIDK
jgi:diaminohydroxyphosphoribosylaminopyrimidine deaminase/5-amino-6-(5-phosphoribosylamino)uracil reductase